MLTWNDILDIELRSKDNPDVTLLINAIRDGDFDDVFRNTVIECVASIPAWKYVDADADRSLDNTRQWEELCALLELDQ
jgi:hypothetical protein